jgi:mono/diheme cytochrome c family protein
VWRALYFKPGKYVATNSDIDRGAYLVQGLGHCDACHAQRDRLGGVNDPQKLEGGLIPVLNWYAPSLTSAHILSDVAEYLKVGKTERHFASGPMAEVVYGSTQFLNDTDAVAIQRYLASLPRSPSVNETRAPASSEIGARVYKDRCESCHGKSGEGVKGAYPALAGNPTVLQATPASLVQVIVEGGFGASTAGNPQPYGMPPYGQVLTPLEIAAVITHIRSSFGNSAGFVSELEVMKYEGYSTVAHLSIAAIPKPKATDSNLSPSIVFAFGVTLAMRSLKAAKPVEPPVKNRAPICSGFKPACAIVAKAAFAIAVSSPSIAFWTLVLEMFCTNPLSTSSSFIRNSPLSEA